MSRILITGAGGGIARAILPVLHDLGHSMLLTTRSRTAALESFLKDADIDAPKIRKSFKTSKMNDINVSDFLD